MIETIYMEIIILLLLVWVIGNKVFPQIIIIFLTLAMLINQITITTNLKIIIGTILLYAVIILYSAAQIVFEGDTEA